MEIDNTYTCPQIEVIELDLQSNLCVVTSGGTQDLWDGGNTDPWF